MEFKKGLIYLLLRWVLTALLLKSLFIKLHFHWHFGLRFHKYSLWGIAIIIAFAAIIWIRKPVFWYLGLLLFIVGIYQSWEYEFYPDRSDLPEIVPTQDIYYRLSWERSNRLLINVVYYFPYFCFVGFLIAFLFNKKVKRYYRIAW